MAVNECFSKSLNQTQKKISIKSNRLHCFDMRTVIFVSILVLWYSNCTFAESDISCSSVKSLFDSKGILSSVDIQETPNSDGGGLCPNLGCCGPSALGKLTSLSKAQLENSLKVDLNKLGNLLGARAFRFDDFFKSLLLQSKHEFHEMFQRTYGMIYERHSFLFMELFQHLERYYSKGDVDLVQVMDHFFTVLYQKMFTVLNQQYNFDEKYLQCVSDHMREIQPFEDVPHKLSIQLRRAFVATRTFQKALQGGGDVVRNMAEAELSPECGKAWSAGRWCGTCSGAGRVASCARRCTNIARACLAHHADLAPHWDAFVDAVDKVADKLLGPFNIAMVVEPIDINISEAIMNFQEHHQTISQRIFAGCGKPVLGGAPVSPSSSQAMYFPPNKRDRRSLYNTRTLISDDNNDFEIEASYESLMNKNPFFRKGSLDYDFDSMEDYAEKAQLREKVLKYARGQIDSEELNNFESRYKRNADPEPKKSLKDVDFDSFNFENSNKPRGGGKKKGGKKNQPKQANVEEQESGARGGAALERLVREARGRVRAARRYFSQLPYLLCEDAGTNNNAQCYNGTHVAPYTLSVAGEGTAALPSNPELRVGPPASSAAILKNAQDSLKALTTKLNNAYNGLDVQWNDFDESMISSSSGSSNINSEAQSRNSMLSGVLFGSGSGSGDLPDDFDDDEDQPRIHSNSNIDDSEGSGDSMPPERTEAPEQPQPTEQPSETNIPTVRVESGVPPVNVDIPVVDGGDREQEPEIPRMDPPKTRPPQETNRPSSANNLNLQKALVTYLFPIVCTWFGGIVGEII